MGEGDVVAEIKIAGTRRRAVGTRDRIMSHLAATGEISDETGMASTLLAKEVGYPGTSIAFAQLLSGMERSGLIRREVRGKRTYRITAAPGSAARLLTAGERKSAARAAAAGVDYDELARRLLVQVVRELAATRRELGWPPGPVQAGSPDGSLQAVLGDSPQVAPGLAAQAREDDGALIQPVRSFDGALAAQLAGAAQMAGIAAVLPGGQDEPCEDGLPDSQNGIADAPGQPGDVADGSAQPGGTLEVRLADLQRELASAQAQHNRISAENARLREQLHAARKNLARLRGRAGRRPVTEDLDADETGLLDHLLSPTGKPSESEVDVPAPS